MIMGNGRLNVKEIKNVIIISHKFSVTFKCKKYEQKKDRKKEHKDL